MTTTRLLHQHIFLACALLFSVSVSAAEVTAPTITYTLDKEAKVSLAVYAADGRLMRHLLLTTPRTAGAHTEEWDGLDEKGKPVSPGAYTWKLLASQGLKAEWMTSLGAIPGPTWQAMPGNHIGAARAAVDTDGNIYLMGGCSEATPAMSKVTPQGQVQWLSESMVQWNNLGGTGVAAGKLYSLLSSGHVIALDPATGKGLWKADTGLGDTKRGFEGNNWLQLAARGNTVVICDKTKNLVRWLKPEDGSMLAESTVPSPESLTLDGQENVYVVSGETVVKLSRVQPKPVTVVQGLPGLSRLAVDVTSGDVLTWQDGDSKQIKRFSSTGKALATYGRMGGRQYGEYDANDFNGVTDLVADVNSGFVVVEANIAPRRVAFFSKEGELVREWYGGLNYGNHGAADPDDVSIVWCHFGREIVKTKVDYQNKNYRILSIYPFRGYGEGMVGDNFDMFQVVRCKGRTYLVGGFMDPGVVMVDEKRQRLLPMVRGDHRLGHDYDKDRYTPPIVRTVFEALPDRKDLDAYIWTDLNGDTLAQASEFVFTPRGSNLWVNGRIWADNDLNLYTMDAQPMVWRPKGWTEAGAPMYGGWTDWKPIGDSPTTFNPIEVSWPAGSGIIPVPGGGLMGFFNSKENPFGKGIMSQGLGGNYIVKWAPDGKVRWVSGRHSPDFNVAPGEMRYLWNIAGLAHGCLVVTDEENYYTHKNLAYVWDPDGLWVGRPLETPDLRAAPEEAYALCTETFGGSMMEVTEKNTAPGLKVGDVLFLGAGQGSTPIYKVTGWDTFRRQAGDLTLTPEQGELAKAASFRYLAMQGSKDKRSKVKLYTTATLPRLATAPVIDGKLDDACWAKSGLLTDLRMSPTEEIAGVNSTTVHVGYDDTNLYLSARCVESKMDKIKALNSPMHLDDCIEFFIDRNYDRNTYYQVILNAKALYYAAKGWSHRPDITITSAYKHDADAWTIEAAIPWAQLNTTAPKPGEKLGFNAIRTRTPEGGSSYTWAPMAGNLYHTPSRFGTLYVGDALPADAVAWNEGRAFARRLPDAGVTLDGKLTEWQGTRPLRIMDGAKLVAEVYLGWKPDGLYAAYDVTTGSPWKNAASTDMVFNGGAGCDLLIGPLLKDQRVVVPGDVRFIAAPLQDGTTVVEFLPLMTTDLTNVDKVPRLYQTPAQGNSPFERVAQLPAGSAAVQMKADGKGYIVEMRVPLRAPLKLESGLRFAFDASVILANKSGTRAELRLPWYSISGDDMFVATDLVVETKLRPWNWGMAELE